MALAASRLFEIARVFVRLDHAARFIFAITAFALACLIRRGDTMLPVERVEQISSASRDLWSLSASPLSRTRVEPARLGGVPANRHVAPTPTAGFRAVNEDPRTVRPLTNAQSIHW